MFSIETKAASNIANYSAVLNGYLTSSETYPFVIGFAWGLDSTCSSGTLEAAEYALWAPGGPFTAVLSGLSPNKTYWFKAMEMGGGNYGSPVSFTTLAATTSPTLTADDATNKTYDGAWLNGRLTSWGTDASDSIALSFQWDVSSAFSVPYEVYSGIAYKVQGAPQSFNAQLTSLSPQMTYYFRAKGVTSAGNTIYGNNIKYFTTPAAPVLTPAIAITPTSGVVGTSVTVSGRNFTAYSPINITIALGTFLGSAATAADGSFSVTVLIPTVGAGRQTVLAQDSQSKYDTCTFTVTTTPPVVIISPLSGKVGDDLRVTGQNFKAYSTITVTIGGVNFGTTTSDASGKFTLADKVPQLTDGDKTVSATDGTHTDTATFKVTTDIGQATIAISPTSGKVGDKVTVTGQDFKASSTITVTIGGVALGTAPSDASGKFTLANKAVPTLTDGKKTVSATDGTNTDTCDFTVGAVTTPADWWQGIMDWFNEGNNKWYVIGGGAAVTMLVLAMSMSGGKNPLPKRRNPRFLGDIKASEYFPFQAYAGLGGPSSPREQEHKGMVYKEGEWKPFKSEKTRVYCDLGGHYTTKDKVERVGPLAFACKPCLKEARASVSRRLSGA